jgi:hypothetical protein
MIVLFYHKRKFYRYRIDILVLLNEYYNDTILWGSKQYCRPQYDEDTDDDDERITVTDCTLSFNVDVVE